jgi:hypothetical protein
MLGYLAVGFVSTITCHASFIVHPYSAQLHGHVIPFHSLRFPIPRSGSTCIYCHYHMAHTQTNRSHLGFWIFSTFISTFSPIHYSIPTIFTTHLSWYSQYNQVLNFGIYLYIYCLVMTCADLHVYFPFTVTSTWPEPVLPLMSPICRHCYLSLLFPCN